jgi:hypothetical protein
MIDLSRAVNDPRLMQGFTIFRSVGSFQAGGWVEGAKTSIAAYGVVTVASVKDVQMLPQADHIGGEMIFYSTTQFYTTSADNSGTSDILVWRGENYRVMQVSPFDDYGFNSAIAVRMKGN